MKWKAYFFPISLSHHILRWTLNVYYSHRYWPHKKTISPWKYIFSYHSSIYTTHKWRILIPVTFASRQQIKKKSSFFLHHNVKCDIIIRFAYNTGIHRCENLAFQWHYCQNVEKRKKKVASHVRIMCESVWIWGMVSIFIHTRKSFTEKRESSLLIFMLSAKRDLHVQCFDKWSI